MFNNKRKKKLKDEACAFLQLKDSYKSKQFKQQMRMSQDFPLQIQNINADHQKSQTFTMGRLYKHKQATFFGPTIYLLNRPKEKSQDNKTTVDKQQSPPHRNELIFQQLQKLRQENHSLKLQREKWYTFDRYNLKELKRDQTQRLITKLKQAQLQWQEKQRKLKAQISQLKEAKLALEMKNEALNRRLEQNLRDIEDTRRKERMRSQVSERVWMDTSRMQTSLQFNSSNLSFYKSMQKEVIVERLKRCEQIIKDQKFIINTQKEQLNKQRQRQSEVAGIYDIEIDSLKKQLAIMQNRANQANQQEYHRFNNQIRQMRVRSIKLEEQLKEKSQVIANQLLIINQKEQQFIQLQKRGKNLQSVFHQKIQKIEEIVNLIKKEKQRQIVKLNETVSQCLEEIQILQANIQHYEEVVAEKELQVQETTYHFLHLLKQQSQLSILHNTEKQRIKPTRIHKSLSTTNVNYKTQTKNQANFSQILTSLAQLKTSNDRSRRLIEKTFKTNQDGFRN